MSDETNPPTDSVESAVPQTAPDPVDRLPVAVSPLTAPPPALVEPSDDDADPDDDLLDDEIVGYEAVSARGHAAGAAMGAPVSRPTLPDAVAQDAVAPPTVPAPALAEPFAAPTIAARTLVPSVAEPEVPAMAPSSVAATAPASASPPVVPPVAAQPVQPTVLYVAPPVPPTPKHNRGFAFGVMLLSSLVFVIVFAAINAGIIGLQSSPSTFATHLEDFARNQRFWVPVAAYVVISIVVGLLLNRAGALAHALASLIVGILVYAGAVGIELLAQQVWQYGTAHRLDLLVALVTAPQLIIAGAVARETALWFGVLQARRGRRVRARNEQAKADFEAEQAGAVPDAA